jgi:hypothetical protein
VLLLLLTCARSRSLLSSPRGRRIAARAHATIGEEEDDEEEEDESAAAAGAAADSSSPSAPPRAVECCVCLEARPLQELRLLAPCGHRCVCAACAAGLLAAPHAQRKCPKCRVTIVYVTRVYDD